MRRFNYNNVTIKVDGAPIFCASASADVRNSLSPSILAGRQSPEEYVVDSHLEGTAQVSYYLSGEDILKKQMISGAGPVPMDLGGMTINSGYLISYSLLAEPYKPVVATANFNIYEDFVGNLISRREVTPVKSILNYNDIEIIESGLNLSGNILSIKYDFRQNVEANILSDSKSISEVKSLAKEGSLILTSYKDNNSFPVEGKNVFISVKSRVLEEDVDNLILNPSFEINSATGIVGFDKQGSVARSQAAYGEGTYSVVIPSVTDFLSFYPVTPMEDGQIYVFSASYRSVGESAIFLLSAPNLALHVHATNGWTRISQAFTNSSSLSQLIKITLTSGSGLYLDSLQLEKGNKASTFTRHSRDRSLLEINGVAVSKKTNHAVGELSTSEYEVKQSGFGKKPVFGRFARGLFGSDTITSIKAGETLFIYGMNLASVSAVIFRQNIEVKDITIYDDRVISVVVPPFARTGRVKLVNSAGETESFSNGVERPLTIISAISF